MYAVSDRWDDALRVSHGVVTVAEVWRAGAPVTDASGATVTLKVTGGQVRLDESSKVRRALTLSSADVDWMPVDGDDLLNPVDTDLRVYSGVRYTEGDVELVPVGVFRVAEPGRRSLLGELDITADDYAGVCARARFLKPWNVARGTPVTVAITSMILDVLPWVTVIDLTGSKTRSPGQTFERERWDAVEDLAAGIGADVAFDPDGNAVIRPMPTVVDPPHWTVDYGHERAVMVDAALSLSSAGVWNAVVATSSATDIAPVSATVVQTTGPLAYRAGFKAPRFYSSALLRTTAQCVAAAESILARSMSLAQVVSATSAPNPALDVGDTLSIPLPGQDPVSRLLTSATIPLGPGPMSLSVRTDAPSAQMEGLS